MNNERTLVVRLRPGQRLVVIAERNNNNNRRRCHHRRNRCFNRLF